MPDDPDGVWSEACDSFGGSVSASFEEIAELCRLYTLMKAEHDEIEKARFEKELESEEEV